MTEQLYGDLAEWWPVISPPSEYAEEATLYVDMIRSAARRPVREVLELGSGGGEDESGRRARYLQWTLPPAPGETSYAMHYAFLLREPDGAVRVAHDVHREGLFGRATWLRLFGEVRLAASLAPRTIEGGEYDSFIAFHDPPQTRDP